MLVLSRRESERILLGNQIVLTVVRIAGDRVRLGIDAPSEILVLREELPSNDPPPLSSPTSNPLDDLGG